MRKILTSALLGSALLFVPVGGAVASAAEAAPATPTVHSMQAELHPTEASSHDERREYRRGFRAGFSDGYQDAKDDCFLNGASTLRRVTEDAWARGYADGYTRGYERAYDRFCG